MVKVIDQKLDQTAKIKRLTQKVMPAINMMERFVESISQANDSNSFDASFEVKNILNSPPQPLVRHRCVTELDREKLEQFMRDFERRQAQQNSNNNNNKNNNNNNETLNQNQQLTPKNSPYLYRKAKAWISSRSSSPRACTPPDLRTFDTCERKSLPERSSYRSAVKMLHFFSSKNDCKSTNKEEENNNNSSSCSSSPVLMRVPLLDDNNEQHYATASLGSASNSESSRNVSPDSSFELHPPLLPSFKVTPPSTSARLKSSKNTAYEFARFLRGSFHAKRASIIKLQRSISNLQRCDNMEFPKPLPPTCNKTKANIKKSTTLSSSSCSSSASLSSPKAAMKSQAQLPVLVDRTNQPAKQRTANSMRVSHF